MGFLTYAIETVNSGFLPTTRLMHSWERATELDKFVSQRGMELRACYQTTKWWKVGFRSIYRPEMEKEGYLGKRGSRSWQEKEQPKDRIHS